MVAPSRGAVVVRDTGFLFAHRLCDGSRVGSVGVFGEGFNFAAASSTGCVYGTQVASDHITVLHAWSCVSGDGAGIRRSDRAALY